MIMLTAYESEYEECPIIIKKFLRYIRTIEGKSSSTIETYYRTLKKFFLYILEFKGIVHEQPITYKALSLVTEDLVKSITKDDVLNFLFELAEEKEKATTRGKDLSALRQYFKYLQVFEGIIDISPVDTIKNPKKPKALPKYLTLEQSVALLNAVDGEFKVRDYCILTLFLNCGLRVSELVNINYTDIRPDNTLVIRGKGNKERVIFLNKPCVKAILNYKKVRPVDELKDRNAFFINKRNNRISVRSVQVMLHNTLAKIGLDNQGFSPHKLRHTAATLMYQNGVDVRSLQEVLGHSNLATTQIYTHVSSKQVKLALETNPLAEISLKNKYDTKK